MPDGTSSTTGSTSTGLGGAATTSSTKASTTTHASSSATGQGGATSSATTTDTTTTSTSTGGFVCGAPCDTSKGADCISECDPAAPDPACDCDNDGEIIDTPMCKAAHAGAKIDCYDCNASANHKATDFFVADRGDGSFDFNCSNIVEPKFSTDCGQGKASCSAGFVYDMSPGCGKNGNLFPCSAGLLSPCAVGSMSNLTPQACH